MIDTKVIYAKVSHKSIDEADADLDVTNEYGHEHLRQSKNIVPYAGLDGRLEGYIILAGVNKIPSGGWNGSIDNAVRSLEESC